VKLATEILILSPNCGLSKTDLINKKYT